MAFRKKAQYILMHQPDILIIPECEHPDRLKFPDQIMKPSDTLWFGANLNKGIGIFSYSQYQFQLLPCYNPHLKNIIPIAVSNGANQFTLFAIWANNPSDPDGTYVEQIWKALTHYKKELKKGPTILMGDFNSNTIWDRASRIGNHSEVVSVLEKRNIHSAYHKHFMQAQGKEMHPTLYMYRHHDKPYHIDYCFASKDLIDKLSSVEIGAYDYWKQYSDHAPIMVTFDK